jgi:hypothetical protein
MCARDPVLLPEGAITLRARHVDAVDTVAVGARGLVLYVVDVSLLLLDGAAVGAALLVVQ